MINAVVLQLFARFPVAKLQLFADSAKYIFQFLASHPSASLIFTSKGSKHEHELL